MNNDNIDQDKEVCFDFPEGFFEAAKCLEAYPDEQQKIIALKNLMRATYSM